MFEFGLVFGVRIFDDSKTFFINVVAWIDANFFNVLNRFHRRRRHEMNVGDQGNILEASGAEIAANRFERLGVFHSRCGDAHDLTTRFSQQNRLLHGRGDVLRWRRTHALQHQRRRLASDQPADLNGTNHHGATGATDVGHAMSDVGRAGHYQSMLGHGCAVWTNHSLAKRRYFGSLQKAAKH